MTHCSSGSIKRWIHSSRRVAALLCEVRRPRSGGAGVGNENGTPFATLIIIIITYVICIHYLLSSSFKMDQWFGGFELAANLLSSYFRWICRFRRIQGKVSLNKIQVLLVVFDAYVGLSSTNHSLVHLLLVFDCVFVVYFFCMHITKAISTQDLCISRYVPECLLRILFFVTDFHFLTRVYSFFYRARILNFNLITFLVRIVM